MGHVRMQAGNQAGRQIQMYTGNRRTPKHKQTCTQRHICTHAHAPDQKQAAYTSAYSTYTCTFIIHTKTGICTRKQLSMHACMHTHMHEHSGNPACLRIAIRTMHLSTCAHLRMKDPACLSMFPRPAFAGLVVKMCVAVCIGVCTHVDTDVCAWLSLHPSANPCSCLLSYPHSHLHLTCKTFSNRVKTFCN